MRTNDSTQHDKAEVALMIKPRLLSHGNGKFIMCEVTKYLMFAREFFENKNGKNSNQINYELQKLSKTNIRRTHNIQ